MCDNIHSPGATSCPHSCVWLTHRLYSSDSALPATTASSAVLLILGLEDCLWLLLVQRPFQKGTAAWPWPWAVSRTFWASGPAQPQEIRSPIWPIITLLACWGHPFPPLHCVYCQGHIQADLQTEYFVSLQKANLATCTQAFCPQWLQLPVPSSVGIAHLSLVICTERELINIVYLTGASFWGAPASWCPSSLVFLMLHTVCPQLKTLADEEGDMYSTSHGTNHVGLCSLYCIFAKYTIDTIGENCLVKGNTLKSKIKIYN